METLGVGLEQSCPRCGQWHVLEARNTAGTPNERALLYVTCRGLVYFAGTMGTPSSQPLRCSRCHGERWVEDGGESVPCPICNTHEPPALPQDYVSLARVKE